MSKCNLRNVNTCNNITGSTQVACYVKDYFSHYTIRSSGCSILVPVSEMRCSGCLDHRLILNAMLHRHLKNADTANDTDTSDLASHTNYRFCTMQNLTLILYCRDYYRYMRTPETRKRLSLFHSKTRVSAQRIKRIERRLEVAIEHRGVQVDDALHRDMCSIMAESSPGVKEQHPPGSFPRIFWEQQEKAGQLNNAKSMRWEPAMIRFVFSDRAIMY